MQKTAIVVPCHNEELRLEPELFLDHLANDPALFFVFVDDGSTDRTAEVIRRMQSANPEQIEILTLPQNQGKAEAVRLGMLQAASGPFHSVGYWDADLSTPLRTIREFSKLLESSGSDLVIGSRVRLLGKRVERNAGRHYLGRIFATFASIFLMIGIYDTQCGAKLFRNTRTVRQVFAEPFTVKWIFDVEMLARFLAATGHPCLDGASRVVEYPLDEWVDVKGSKVKAKDFFLSGVEFLLLFCKSRLFPSRVYKGIE